MSWMLLGEEAPVPPPSVMLFPNLGAAGWSVCLV